MNELKNLLINNWQLIVAAVIFILSFILQLIKKKPIEILPSIMEMIYRLVPEAINSYEKLLGAGHGPEKKDAVVRFVMNSISRIYPLNDAQYHAYELDVKLFTEKILSTPQKKGGQSNAK